MSNIIYGLAGVGAYHLVKEILVWIFK